MTEEQVADLDRYATRVRNALTALSFDRDRDGIAEVLRELGIKGTPVAAEICPLARYVRQTAGLPDDYVFSIFSTWSLKAPNYYVRTDETPIEAYWFARKFDQGRYPDLQEGAVSGAGELTGKQAADALTRLDQEIGLVD